MAPVYPATAQGLLPGPSKRQQLRRLTIHISAIAYDLAPRNVECAGGKLWRFEDAPALITGG